MIKIDGLVLHHGDTVIFEGFSMFVPRGEKVAVTGKSGIGKTSLLNLLTGFVTGFSGKVEINQLPLTAGNIRKIRSFYAWLPQDTSLNFDTVSDVFFAPFDFETNGNESPARCDIEAIFDVFEIETSLLSKKLNEISGGQRQRVLLASCLLLNKEILLLDEPTSALDIQLKKRIADYILSRENLTVIAVTHDEYWIKQSDKIINLNQ